MQTSLSDMPFFFFFYRVLVHFRALEAPNEDVCVLELSRDMLYKDTVEQLAIQIECDAAKIRLTQHSAMYNKPRMQPIKSSPTMSLTEMYVLKDPLA